MVERWKKYR